MIKFCPSCRDIELPDNCIEARVDKSGKLSIRPLKRPWKACPNPACRRVINILTGEVWKGNKREVKYES